MVDELENKYKGKSFVFKSPFQITPGFQNGDKGVLLRRCMSLYGDPIDPAIDDGWLAENSSGGRHMVWGLECYREDGTPLIPEQAEYTENNENEDPQPSDSVAF